MSFLVILTKASVYFLIETIRQALGKKILYWCRNNVGIETICNAKILFKVDTSRLIFLILKRSYVSFSDNSSPFYQRICTKAIFQLKSVLKDLL